MSLFDRWASALDALRASGRFRALVASEGVDLTTNDYLGYGGGRTPSGASHLGDDWDWADPRSGIASRLLRGNHPIWEEVESALARWHSAEASLVVTSGYVANEGLLSTVVRAGDWVASDERNHASLIDGLQLAGCERFVFRHNDLDHLEAGLEAEAGRTRPERELFIVTESLTTRRCSPPSPASSPRNSGGAGAPP
jgi:8-amino-7-oxononanoate synthase